MKLKNKILMFAATAAMIATITPVVLTSCSKDTDIYLPSNQKKELDLFAASGGGVDYATESGSLMLDFVDKLHFAESEKENRELLVQCENLKLNGSISDKFTVKLCDGNFSYIQGKPETLVGWTSRIGIEMVDSEELTNGDIITFDMKITLCTADGTALSQTVNFTGWKLTAKLS